MSDNGNSCTTCILLRSTLCINSATPQQRDQDTALTTSLVPSKQISSRLLPPLLSMLPGNCLGDKNQHPKHSLLLQQAQSGPNQASSLVPKVVHATAKACRAVVTQGSQSRIKAFVSVFPNCTTTPPVLGAAPRSTAGATAEARPPAPASAAPAASAAPPAPPAPAAGAASASAAPPSSCVCVVVGGCRCGASPAALTSWKFFALDRRTCEPQQMQELVCC